MRSPARFSNCSPRFEPLYLRRMKNPAALVGAWAQLQQILQHRYRNAQEYEGALAEGDWQQIEPGGNRAVFAGVILCW